MRHLVLGHARGEERTYRALRSMRILVPLLLMPVASMSAQRSAGVQPLGLPHDEPLVCRSEQSGSQFGLQFRIGNKLNPERVVDIEFDSTGNPVKLSESALVWFGNDSIVVHGFVVAFAGQAPEGGVHFRSTRYLTDGARLAAVQTDSVRHATPRSLEQLSVANLDRAAELAHWLWNHRCR